MKLRQTVKLALLGILFGVASTSFAGDAKYYSTTTVKTQSGNGKVYIGTSKTAPASDKYDNTMSQTQNGSSTQDATYYLFAKPNSENDQFDGWYSEADLKNCISTANPYEVTTTGSAAEGEVAVIYYAKFSDASVKYYSELTVNSVGANCTVAVETSGSVTPTYGNIKTAQLLGDTHSTHTYYVYAKTDADKDFGGWYTDEECTELYSMKAACLYEIKNLSEESSNPTKHTLYAKYITPKKYQLRNSSFEEWESVKYSSYTSDEPKYWSSFLTSSGDMKGTAFTTGGKAISGSLNKSTEIRPGSKGGYSAQLTPYAVMSVNAQGNLTNGCINMGSTTALEWTKNYNYTVTDNDACKFTGKPDAVNVWVKFTSSVKYGAKVSVILHDDSNSGYMQDPNDDFTYVSNDNGTETKTTGYKKNFSKSTSTVIAEAAKKDILNNSEWQNIVIPFNYINDIRPSYALVSFASSSTPGKCDLSDVLLVDDFTFIYNSELESVVYDGNPVTLSDNTATIDATYKESLLTLTSNGKGATIEKNYDNTTGVLSITVKGDDISEEPNNYHVYTLQFTPKTGTTKTYNKYVGVTVNGDLSAPVAAPIKVTYYEDNTIDFNLENFCLGDIGVGNIALNNLNYATDGTFSYNGKLEIAAGNDTDIEEWIGPGLGEIPLNLQGTVTEDYFYVTIAIDMTESIGQVIDVEVGDLATANVSISNALVSTFCAPFKVSIAAALPEAVASLADYITASTVTAADESGVLTLSKINDIIPAHTPIIIEANQTIKSYMPVTLPVSGIYSQGTPEAGMLVGTYEETDAPADSYILQNQSGVVGFYHVSTSHTVKANRCWLVAPDSSVKAFIIRTDETEGINGQTIENRQQTIFNLQGQRINNVQKGVNIVNGKKVIR